MSINFKYIQREKAPSNKFPTLSKSMYRDMPVIGTSNQLSIRGFFQNFRETKVLTGKTPFFMIGSFCTPYSIYPNIEF